MPIETPDEFRQRQQQDTGEGPVETRRGFYLFANGAVLDTVDARLGIPVGMTQAPPANSPGALTAASLYWKRRLVLSCAAFQAWKNCLTGRGGDSFNFPDWHGELWGVRPETKIALLLRLSEVARQDKKRLAQAEQAVRAANLPKVLSPEELNQARWQARDAEKQREKALRDEANVELDKINI